MAEKEKTVGLVAVAISIIFIESIIVVLLFNITNHSLSDWGGILLIPALFIWAAIFGVIVGLFIKNRSNIIIFLALISVIFQFTSVQLYSSALYMRYNYFENQKENMKHSVMLSEKSSITFIGSNPKEYQLENVTLNGASKISEDDLLILAENKLFDLGIPITGVSLVRNIGYKESIYSIDEDFVILSIKGEVTGMTIFSNILKEVSLKLIVTSNNTLDVELVKDVDQQKLDELRKLTDINFDRVNGKLLNKHTFIKDDGTELYIEADYMLVKNPHLHTEVTILVEKKRIPTRGYFLQGIKLLGQ